MFPFVFQMNEESRKKLFVRLLTHDLRSFTRKFLESWNHRFTKLALTYTGDNPGKLKHVFLVKLTFIPWSKLAHILSDSRYLHKTSKL